MTEQNKQRTIAFALMIAASWAFALALGTSGAIDKTLSTGVHAAVPIGEPCTSTDIVKLSTPVTASGQQVAAVAGKMINVCSFYATLGGTNPTMQFQYGTGSNCGTGTANLSGAFAPAPNGTEFFMEVGSTMIAPAGNALCVTLGGTSPTIAGVLSYVQQ